MKYDNETIKKLKAIGEQGIIFGKLDPELQEALKEIDNGENIKLVHIDMTAEIIAEPAWSGGTCYFLDQEWEAQETEAEGRWVPYPIVRKRLGYAVDTGCDNYEYLTDAVMSPENMGLFGGVQYEGQRAINHWSMATTSFIDSNGGLQGRSNKANKPATPIKARFWVEG